MKVSEFCYPYKKTLLEYVIHIFLDVEKDNSEETIAQLWCIIEVIQHDLTFLALSRRSF